MLRTLTRILIEQVSTTANPGRTKKFTFNFVHSLEIVSSWANLTDTAKIVFPKKIYFVDGNGKKFSWDGRSKNLIEGTNPLLLRGDKITISLGYLYYNKSGAETTQLNEEFTGYITKVINKQPITIECEDNMFLLKKLQAPNKVYPQSSYDLQKIIKELVASTSFKVVSGATASILSTSIGNFRTQNETVAQVIERIRKDYHIETYFRGSELRCSGIVYYPTDRRTRTFTFQSSIINDQLEYRRKDDVPIGITAYSINEDEQTTFNSYGFKNKKQKRLQTTVGATDGEMRTLYFLNVTTEADLKTKATERLNRLYYEGFYGSFTAFGLPTVRHGDAVVLVDPVLPERNGTYLVKQVTKTMSADSGFKQEIMVDIRIDSLTASEIALGL